MMPQVAPRRMKAELKQLQRVFMGTGSIRCTGRGFAGSSTVEQRSIRPRYGVQRVRRGGSRRARPSRKLLRLNRWISSHNRLIPPGGIPLLPPMAFYKYVTVTPVSISRSHPHCMLPWWDFPTALLPCVGMTIPSMVAANPNMPAAWSGAAVLPNGNRRPELNDNLCRSGRAYSKSNSTQCGQK